jgi:hypothetical protein
VITENLTHVKAAHIQTLRTAVNTVRNYHYLTPISWNEEIIVGKTTIKNWPFHILEIRKAIEPVITMINGFDDSSTFDVPPVTWLSIGSGRPRADVMNQLYDLLLTL